MEASMPARVPIRKLPLERPPLPEAGFLNAMAIVAIGMFVGTWIIGPLMSSDAATHVALNSAAEERTMINAGMARPDPSPYRAPTPAFEAPAETHYGKLAKERALAVLGPRRGESNAEADAENAQALDEWQERPRHRSRYRSWRYDRYGRHSIY
jgi:hypothetical protein